MAKRTEGCPSLTTPVIGTPIVAASSATSAARSALVAESRLLASSTSPDRQSRSTHKTSCPTSGCSPSRARITRPCRARTARSRSSSASAVAMSSSPGSGFAGPRAGSAVEQVGDRAFGDRHPALAQAAVDLRHAAVLAVAPGADQGDDVKAELVLRQHDRPLGFRPIGLMAAGAARVLAAVTQPAATRRTALLHCLEHLLTIRRRARRSPGHHQSPSNTSSGDQLPARSAARGQADREEVLAPIRQYCPGCGRRLRYRYDNQRTVVTLGGLVHLRLQIRRCDTSRGK